MWAFSKAFQKVYRQNTGARVADADTLTEAQVAKIEAQTAAAEATRKFLTKRKKAESGEGAKWLEKKVSCKG